MQTVVSEVNAPASNICVQRYENHPLRTCETALAMRDELRVLRRRRADLLGVDRLRIGIGTPDSGKAVDHVLSRFRKAELQIVQSAIDCAADAVEIWASEGPEAAMNRFNPSSME